MSIWVTNRTRQGTHVEFHKRKNFVEINRQLKAEEVLRLAAKKFPFGYSQKKEMFCFSTFRADDALKFISLQRPCRLFIA